MVSRSGLVVIVASGPVWPRPGRAGRSLL